MQMRCQALNLLINPKSIFAMQKQRGAGRLLNCRKQQMLTNMNAHFCQILAFSFFFLCWAGGWRLLILHPSLACRSNAICSCSLLVFLREGLEVLSHSSRGAVHPLLPLRGCLEICSTFDVSISERNSNQPPHHLFFFFFFTASESAQCVQPGFSWQQPPRQNLDHRFRSRHGESDLPQLLCLKRQSDTGNQTV